MSAVLTTPAAAPAVASRVAGFWGSSIGKKVVMAVTGFVLFGFVCGHLVGNSLVYLGPGALNAYAKGLRKLPALLWGFRIAVGLSAVLHVWAATAVTLTSWAARPKGYRRWQAQESDYASRTMRWGGVLLLLFVIFHLLHLTFGRVMPFDENDVYRNVVTGFQNPLVSGFYIGAMVALGLHLYHGFWSFLQTLGLNHPGYNDLRKKLAVAFAVVIAGGNISIPVAILAGLVK